MVHHVLHDCDELIAVVGERAGVEREELFVVWAGISLV